MLAVACSTAFSTADLIIGWTVAFVDSLIVSAKLLLASPSVTLSYLSVSTLYSVLITLAVASTPSFSNTT